MKHPLPDIVRRPSGELLTPEQVRTILTTDDPMYGADFESAEWERITFRLTSLARLLYGMSRREAAGRGGRASTSAVNLREDDQNACDPADRHPGQSDSK